MAEEKAKNTNDSYGDFLFKFVIDVSLGAQTFVTQGSIVTLATVGNKISIQSVPDVVDGATNPTNAPVQLTFREGHGLTYDQMGSLVDADNDDIVITVSNSGGDFSIMELRGSQLGIGFDPLGATTGTFTIIGRI